MDKEKVFLYKTNKNIKLNNFAIKTFFENPKILEVKNIREANIVITETVRGENKILDLKNKKVLLISSENLNWKRNLFNLLESFFNLFLKEKKYRFMDRLDKLIPKKISSIPITLFLQNYLKFVKEIQRGSKKNSYAILCDKNKGRQLFSLPLFIQQYYNEIFALADKKVDKEIKRRKFCAFIVSSNSSRERIEFFKKLSKYKKVDSFGKVYNNMGDFSSTDWKDNEKLFKDYKFVICFENSFVNEYITEKLPNVMFANSIPIYRGAPNIGKYFNTQSFINYEDYGKSYDKMIERIIELDNNDSEYLEILKEPWFKNNKIPKNILNKKRELGKFYEEILKNG
jgi:hypothetical protein